MKPSPQPIRRLLARGLLALMLLVAQQTASLHWLSHAIDATRAKATQGSAPAAHCDECAVIGALGAAATAPPFAFPAASGGDGWLAGSRHAAAPTPLRLAFRSRAPPLRV